MDSNQLEQVGNLLREVALDVVLPGFRADGGVAVHEKSPGEPVTAIDREAERRLIAGLELILPGTPVIGEESWPHGQPLDPDALRNETFWVIDPLDGTGAFAGGDEEFAIMVALIRLGETVASWIHAPVHGWLATAELGSGAFADGRRLQTALPPNDAGTIGSVRLRFLPEQTREHVERAIPAFGTVLLAGSSAWDHVALAGGWRHFSLYYRTLIWDHAPGCLIVSEAGGKVARLDGTPYDPLDNRTGLLTAADAQIWSDIRQRLLPDHV